MQRNSAKEMTLATAHKHITRRGIGYRGSNHFRGSERKTATRQMRDRVERIMKECEGMSSGHSDSEAENKCDCCSAEIKALFTEWIANRENTLKTKEIADKLIPLMEKCGSSFSASLSETATGSFLHICKRLLGSAGAAVGVIIPAL